MNILKITQSNKIYIVEFNDQTLYILNLVSLRYHLKHQAKLTQFAIASIASVLTYQPTVEVDLNRTQRKVS